MTLVSFQSLMQDAGENGYAVGYFESWSLESLYAVADAAEAVHSPVILGFSGISLPHPHRVVPDRLSPYAALGLEVCRQIAVPSCLIFNESPDLDWVLRSVDCGFSVVMYADEEKTTDELLEPVRRTVAYAHPRGAAVEAEMASPPGLSADLHDAPLDRCLTGPADARRFVEETGIDALAVNVGQVHLHGRGQVELDLARLVELRKAVPVPLVLHGATSVRPDHLAEAARLGAAKINVGSVIKRAFFEEMRVASIAAGDHYSPYDVIGSGLDKDVLTAGRVAMQRVVEDMMRLFGSAGKA